MENYKGYKKTNMITYPYNKGARRVYICTKEGKYKGKLFYRMYNCWHGTFKEYCYESNIKL